MKFVKLKDGEYCLIWGREKKKLEGGDGCYVMLFFG